MSDRQMLLQKINEASFAVNDITLYLDTHPTDTEALAYFKKAMNERKTAMKEFESKYEPLIVDCVNPCENNKTGFASDYPSTEHWTWADGPIPWDNQPD